MSNYSKLDYGYYIVRTQAGYKQAIKDFNEESYKQRQTEFLGYPKSYPSIVKFRDDWDRGIVLTHCDHVNYAIVRFKNIVNALEKA